MLSPLPVTYQPSPDALEKQIQTDMLLLPEIHMVNNISDTSS